MGNLINAIGKQSAVIDLNHPEEGLYDLISFDLDFTENEEYFREDTISLGYDNEAERLVKEYLKENELKNQKDVFECCSNLLEKVFDSSYYGDNTLDVIQITKTKFKVITTYQY